MLEWTITVMAGSRPHQTSPHYAESANVHQQGELHDLEHGDDMRSEERRVGKEC